MSLKRQRSDSDKESVFGPATAAEGIGILKFDSPSEATVYERIQHYEFWPARYMDEEYGLSDRITKYLVNIGWDLLPLINFPAYREPTLEFLATFSLSDCGDESPIMVTFQLNQQWFVMSLAEFNIHLGFETEDTVKTPEYINALHGMHPDFVDNKFWAEITGGDSHYNPNQSKCTGIRDLCLRFLHRWIAHSISACKENVEVVTKWDLFFRWCMVTGRRCDAGRFLLARCANLRQKSNSENKRYIAIGSFISYLARNLEALHPQAQIIAAMDPIDHQSLLDIGVIYSPAPGHWVLNGSAEPAVDDVPPPPVPPNMDTDTIALRLDRLETQTTEQFDRLKVRLDAQDAKLPKLDHTHQLLQAHFGAHPSPPSPPNMHSLVQRLDHCETKMASQFERLEAHLDAQDTQLALLDQIHKLLQTHFGASSLPSLGNLALRPDHLEAQMTSRFDRIEARLNRLNGLNVNGSDATLHYI